MRLSLLGTLSLEAKRGREVNAVMKRPKCLALLIYLAAASPRGFQRRDKLVALFWPEVDTDRARHALRQVLYVLRRALPTGVLVARGVNELGLSPGHCWCDVREFERAFGDGRYEDACELYRGDFADGLHVRDVSPEFEYWISAERERYGSMALEAALNLADEASESGDGQRAAWWAGQGLQIAPFNESALQRQVRILDGMGDRSGALNAYRQFADRIRFELDIEPSPETQALADAVRNRTGLNAAAQLPPEATHGDPPDEIPPGRSVQLQLPVDHRFDR